MLKNHCISCQHSFVFIVLCVFCLRSTAWPTRVFTIKILCSVVVVNVRRISHTVPHSTLVVGIFCTKRVRCRKGVLVSAPRARRTVFYIHSARRVCVVGALRHASNDSFCVFHSSRCVYFVGAFRFMRSAQFVLTFHRLNVSGTIIRLFVGKM